MRKFIHFDASSVEEAASILNRYGNKASIFAGGTDLLGKMKDEILPSYPEAIVNLKTIPGFDFIQEDEGHLRIGALTRLEDIATHPTIKTRFPALSQAAHKTASTHIREMGTIAGNLCQDIRCWYYRAPQNRFPCLRKGGGKCYAILGDNRFHSIFGGSVKGGCFAVHPSDTAPALIALNAQIKTSKRMIPTEDLFQVQVTKTTVLEPDEIITEIVLPYPSLGSKSAFNKFALRKSIDFPIVNCAASITTSEKRITGARICLNAVYVKPYRAIAAEETIVGKDLSDGCAEEAGVVAVSQALPLAHNQYMVQIAKIMVQRSILDCQ